MSMSEKQLKKLQHYRLDPVYWVEDIFGATPTYQQSQLLEEYIKPGAHVSARSGHGVGKTTSLAWILMHFLLFFPEALVPCTAPSGHQLFDVLWAEVQRWWDKMDPWWKNQLLITKSRIDYTGPGSKRFAVARTARAEKPEALAGFHSANIMFLVDEACHDEQTEILTSRGWMFFKDINPNERVLTMDPALKKAYYAEISKKIVKQYEGDMYEYNARGCSFKVTPDHNMYVRHRRHSEYQLRPVNKVDFNNYYMCREVDMYDPGGEFTDAQLADIEFLGWFYSEGSVAYVNGEPYSVVISQQKPGMREKIKKVITRMGFSFKEYDKSIQIHNHRLASTMAEAGRDCRKFELPDRLRFQPPFVIKRFLDAFTDGDGYDKGTSGRKIIYTSSEKMASQLHELCLLAGESSTLTKRNIKGQRKWIIDHWATSSVDGWVISRQPNVKEICLRKKNLRITPYKGKVYCVKVEPHHLIYTRRNGVAMWGGNSAVHNAIFEVAEGALSTPGARVILTSNPTRTEGYFYDSHHGDAKDWKRLHFSCLDSPLTTRVYAEKQARKYGTDSDVYAIRVLGNFPSKSADVLIALDVIEECYGRDVENTVSPRVAGLDIARFGDDASAIVIRQGAVIRYIEEWRNRDTMWTVGHVQRLFRRKLFDRVAVDVIGIGSGVVDRLKELRVPVIEVNVAESAAARQDFHRLRDELWWKSKEFMEAKVGGVDTKNVTRERFMDLAAELSSVRYDYRGARLRIFSKKEMKKLGLASPNIADAFNLTFASEITGLRGAAGQGRRDVQPAGGGAFLG